MAASYPPWFVPALIWTSRLSGMLSTLGSLAIIYIIISDRRRKLARPKNRFMLFMSIFDSIQSIAMAVSTAGTLRPWTCQIQGICIWLGLGVPFYNSSLNLFYVMSIRYNMDSAYFSAKIEPYLHAVSIICPIAIAISYASAGLIGSVNGHICWTKGIPVVYAWGLPVMFCFIFCFLSMASVCQAVTRQSNDMQSYSFGMAEINRNLELKETRDQAVRITFVFFLTFIFPLAQGFTYNFMSDTVYSIFLICTMIFYPLQGFWNFIFYSQRNLEHVRKMNPEKCLLQAVREVVFDARAVADSLISRRSPRRASIRLMRTLPKLQSPSLFRRATETKVEIDIKDDESPQYDTVKRHISFISPEEDKQLILGDASNDTLILAKEKGDHDTSLADEDRYIKENNNKGAIPELMAQRRESLDSNHDFNV